MILGWLRRRIAELAVRDLERRLEFQERVAESLKARLHTELGRDVRVELEDAVRRFESLHLRFCELVDEDHNNRETLLEIRDGVTKPLEPYATEHELNAMWEDLSASERRTALNLFIGWRARKAGVSP